MGRAGCAPSAVYRRRRVVAHHAVERLRQRIAESRDIAYRHGHDLANVIDTAVDELIAAGQYDRANFNGVDQLIVHAHDRLGGLHAVVEPRGRRRDVVVTLLRPEMAANRLRQERWQRDAETACTTSLGMKLKLAMRSR